MKRLTISLPALLLALGLCGSPGALAAGMYKWVDEQGNVHFSQNPPASGSYQEMTPPPTPATPAEDTNKQLERYREILKPDPKAREEAAAAKQQEQLRRQNCETARKNLETYTAFRRFIDAKGELVVLTDEERAAKIKDAEEQVKTYCK